MWRKESIYGTCARLEMNESNKNGRAKKKEKENQIELNRSMAPVYTRLPLTITSPIYSTYRQTSISFRRNVAATPLRVDFSANCPISLRCRWWSTVRPRHKSCKRANELSRGPFPSTSDENLCAKWNETKHIKQLNGNGFEFYIYFGKMKSKITHSVQQWKTTNCYRSHCHTVDNANVRDKFFSPRNGNNFNEDLMGPTIEWMHRRKRIKACVCVVCHSMSKQRYNVDSLFSRSIHVIYMAFCNDISLAHSFCSTEKYHASMHTTRMPESHRLDSIQSAHTHRHVVHLAICAKVFQLQRFSFHSQHSGSG